MTEPFLYTSAGSSRKAFLTWLGLVLTIISLVVIVTSRQRVPLEHWVFRVTTPAGIVIHEMQGSGCAITREGGRVWNGRGNTYDNATFQIAAGKLTESYVYCMRLK